MRRFTSAVGLGAAACAIAMLVACGLDIRGVASTPPDANAPVSNAPSADALGDATDIPTSSDASFGDADVALDAQADAPSVTAGNALSFASGAYVNGGNSIAIPTDFTIEAWVRPTSFGGERYIVAKDRAGQGAGQCRLGLDATGRLFFILSDSGGSDHGLYNGAYVLRTPAALSANVWAHVAVTKSGAAFALVVNGASVASATATASFAHGGPAVSLRIGARVASDGAGVDGAFVGAIDEVRVFSVARSASQIAASMKTVVPDSTATLAASFRFSEGAGSTTANGKGGSATLVATPQWVTSTAF